MAPGAAVRGDPGRRTYPFLDCVGPIAFAHRGGAAGGLENSLAAFGRAVDLGYRYLETDVHATADGVAVAFHDATLDRVTDSRGRVRDQPWSRLRAARIGGREPIPRLDELLDAFPQARVNLDVKHASAIAPMIEVVRRTASVSRVCVGSFSGRRLSLVRRALGPALATSFGPRSVAGLLAACGPRPPEALLRRLVPPGVPCVQVPPRLGAAPLVTRRFLDVAHTRGLVVHVWTVDDRAEMVRLLDLGVDGLMTDDLDTLREVLRGRGCWPT